MQYLSLLGLGLVVFVSTDIDDLLLLVVLLADRRLSARQVVVGQYLGFLGMLIVSVACSLLAVVIPACWLGLLGIWPLVMGVRRLLHRSQGDVVGTAMEAATPSLNTLSVALITLANGGDNITVYVPLLASLNALQIGILAMEFLILLAVWCAAAWLLVTHPKTGGAVRRIASAILPYALIGLGAWILLRSLPLFAVRI